MWCCVFRAPHALERPESAELPCSACGLKGHYRPTCPDLHSPTTYVSAFTEAGEAACCPTDLAWIRAKVRLDCPVERAAELLLHHRSRAGVTAPPVVTVPSSTTLPDSSPDDDVYDDLQREAAAMAY